MEGKAFDLELDDGVNKGIQIILNAFSGIKKNLSSIQEERDSLLAQNKLLNIELQECKQREFCHRSPDNSMDEKQRKRIKLEADQFDDSIHMKSVDDISNDELNAAFHLSMNEDEIIEPTPGKLYKPNPNILKKVTPIKSPISLNEQNKENDLNMTDGENLGNIAALERSPTVLSKYSNKMDVKQTNRKLPAPFRSNESKDVSVDCQAKNSHTLREPAQWHAKIKSTTLTNFFENHSSGKRLTTSPHHQKSTLNPRKKTSLSLPRLRQSTILFQKCNEETFCESGATEINNDQMETSANSNVIASVSKSMKSPDNVITSTAALHPLVAGGENKNYDNDSPVSLAKNSTEAIIIDESQSTQELYLHVLNIKKELEHETSMKSPKSAPKPPPISIDCEDCKEYHRMLGRDVEKNPPRKYGVCSKHHRNIPRTDTPTGFWNPKISDSDSDHEDTPYDYRYAKDRN